MTPGQEEIERGRVENEAYVILIAALEVADRAAIRGYMSESERAEILEKISKARDLGWSFVRDNAIDERIGEVVYGLRDSDSYASLALGWMYAYSSRLLDADIANGEAPMSPKESGAVLSARREGRARAYAVESTSQAMEIAKLAVVERLVRLVQPTKKWRSQRDGRVRVTHNEANGQEVPINEYFNVGGYQMAHPQDPRAPAKETANCRCFLVYSINWSKKK